MSPSLKPSTNLLAIVACLLWSTAFVGIKIGIQYTTPLHFAGVRFFLAGVLVLPFSGPLRHTAAIARRNVLFILRVAIFSTVLVYALFYLGISMGSASTTAIVIGAGPLFIAIMAHLILPDERFTLRKILSLAVGLFGIVLIAASRYEAGSVGRTEFWSVLLLLGCNISGGYANILVSKQKQEIPALALSALQLIVGGGILILLSCLVEHPPTTPKPVTYFGALAYLSFLSASAMTIWFVILKRPHVKVSEINIWKFIIPVFGAILSWVLLEDDHPDAVKLTGMTAIGLALILMHLGPSRPE